MNQTERNVRIAQAGRNLLSDRPASWVIVDKATGKAVFETYRQETADAINRDRYHVLGIGEYLGSLNSAILDGTSEPDASRPEC